MTVPDRYLRAPFTATRSTSLQAAAQSMREHQVGALLVVDDDDRLVGVVTDRDLTISALCEAHDPAATAVETCMSSPVVSMPSTGNIILAASLMRRHAVKRLPILGEDERVVGILTSDDLVREFGNELRWLGESIRTGIDNEANPPEHAVSIFGKE